MANIPLSTTASAPPQISRWMADDDGAGAQPQLLGNVATFKRGWDPSVI